jgi:hypothetical protein
MIVSATIDIKSGQRYRVRVSSTHQSQPHAKARASVAAAGRRRTSIEGDDPITKKAPRKTAGLFVLLKKIAKRRMKHSVLGRPGNDLLFQAL